MDSFPTISIVTPVWNGMTFLKECVDSVLSQSFENWEMLISDDGSTDGSRDYLKTITDSRIKIFYQEKNLGIFGNLNFVFEQSKAQISQILCQDDYFLSAESLITIVKYWEVTPDTVGFVRFNHSGEKACKLVELQKAIVPNIVDHDFADLYFFIFGNIPGNLSNVSLRTKIVKETGFFQQRLPYAGDFDFWSRAARLTDMGVEDRMVVFVRRHPGTASVFLNRKGELIAQTFEVVSGLYSRLVDRFPSNKFMLKLHSTMNYDSLQRDAGLKLWLKGKSSYLNELEKNSKGAVFTLNSVFARWGLFFLSLGGRIGRPNSARKLIELKS